jgi:hypothetical protein
MLCCQEYNSGMRLLLGIVLAVTPLALWIAWTPALVLAVMAISLVGAVLLVVLNDRSPEAQRGSGEAPAPLPEEFIDEVHRLFPLTYHHTLVGNPRFERVMTRLRRLIDRQG